MATELLWFCEVEYPTQTVHFSSPLTANIYLPAIPTIATAFDKSIELINLTVTVYMVLQGVCKLHCLPGLQWFVV